MFTVGSGISGNLSVGGHLAPRRLEVAASLCCCCLLGATRCGCWVRWASWAMRAGAGENHAASVFHHEGTFLPPLPELMTSTAAAATHWLNGWRVRSLMD